jgi:hypothetical protein
MCIEYSEAGGADLQRLLEDLQALVDFRVQHERLDATSRDNVESQTPS